MDNRLLEPIKVGKLTFKNRIMFPPLTTGYEERDGSIGDRSLSFYERLAKGGTAYVVIGDVAPVRTASPTPKLYDDSQIPVYKKLADTLHAYDCKVALQLFHPEYDVPGVGRMIMQAGMARQAAAKAQADGNTDEAAKQTQLAEQLTKDAYAKLHHDMQHFVSEASVEQLGQIKDSIAVCAKRAAQAGIDAIEVHGDRLVGSLCSKVLNHRTDEYGGSFENRTRLLRNGIAAAKVHEDEKFLVTARIGIYDGFAYPYGFGVKEGEGLEPDMEEPIRLVRTLHETYGLSMVNLTMGNPYVSTHVTRPFDGGKYIPDEHPLYGVARIIQGIGEVKKAVPDMFISASGPSYLRQYSDLYAAGAVEEGLCDNILFGRMSFANPAFPKQIMENGRIDSKMICVACGKCGDLIRAGKPTGCIVRDTEVYLKYYREYQAENKA